MSSSDEDDVGLARRDGALAADGTAPCWRYCLHIAYFGTGFVGWQRQLEVNNAGQGSVQDAVERAVTETVHAAQRVHVTSCSRTDAGTHALSQYGTIKLMEDPRLSTHEFQQRVNELLPDGVRVLKIEQLPASLKPSRFRSKYKKYVYYIQQGHRPDLDLGKYSWFLGRRIDIERLREALSLVVGTHDFRPFSQGMQKAEFADRSSVRTIVSARVRVRRNVVFSLDPLVCGTGEIIKDPASLYNDSPYQDTTQPTQAMNDADGGGSPQPKKPKMDTTWKVPVHFVCIELVATGFLRHMVRRIIGTARPIAEGTFPASRMKQVLNGELECGPSAPSKGLWLHRTWLTEADWDNDATKDD